MFLQEKKNAEGSSEVCKAATVTMRSEVPQTGYKGGGATTLVGVKVRASTPVDLEDRT